MGTSSSDLRLCPWTSSIRPRLECQVISGPFWNSFLGRLWSRCWMVGVPFFRRRHQTSVTAVSEEVERQLLQRNSSVHKTKHGKSGRGIWSLAIELLAAVAIRLAQRHVKSWSSALIVQINNSPDGPAPLSFNQVRAGALSLNCTIE
jgi:hypothetical protein